jgi:SPP1 gp7 family putative phage head morphogenesis protein
MNVVTRQQVRIEEYKAHVTESFQKFLTGMKRDILKRLPGPDDVEIRDISRLRLEKMLGHVHQDLHDRYGKHYGVWREQMVDFAQYDAELQGKTMKQLFDIDFDIPTRAQLRSAVLSPITGMNGINNGMTPREFYSDWVGRGVKRVERIISRGYYQGLTTTQIVREVIGTKSAHYNDGEFARLYRDMETMTRTVVQHAATQARIETLRENDDVVSQLQVVATLDDRTSLLCMSMDGKILDLDSNNLPPYHPGCRTTIVPVLKPPFNELGAGGTRFARGADGSEVVPAGTQYFTWLQSQPRGFVESAIGPKRAALLLDGKLTAERFNELNMGMNFEPRTLAQIKKMEKHAFEEAGI